MARLYPVLILALVLSACGELALSEPHAADPSAAGADAGADAGAVRDDGGTPEAPRTRGGPVPDAEAPPEGWPVAVKLPEGARAEYERVVLVTIDTLRADHVSCYGYPRQTTPFLDSLAARGVLFERAMAAVSHTAPSHATMLTGLVPAVHGVLENGNKLDPEAQDLGLLFRSAGFETAAFLNVRFLAGVARSFEHVDASKGPGKPNGADVVERAIEWAREGRTRERFFLWVHLYDPHNWSEDVQVLVDGPATLWKGETPQGFLGTLAELHGLPAPGEDPASWRVDWRVEREPRGVDLGEAAGFQACIDAYDERTLFADRQVERLYAAVEGLGLPGRTLWILTSDHGEGLAGHGVSGHGSRIYQEQLHVPLVLHASDGSLGPRVVPEMVGHIDLYPTVAATLGGSVVGHPRLYEGRSLWPLMRGEPGWTPRPLFAQRKPVENAATRDLYALQDDGHKFILNVGGTSELFDLASDPRELVDLGPDAAAAVRLRAALEARLRDYSALREGGEQEEVPEEWLQELRDLGYVR